MELPTLKAWRLYRGLSLKMLAERAGIHWTTVWRVETGKTKASAETVQALATALEVRPHQLLDLKEPGTEGTN